MKLNEQYPDRWRTHEVSDSDADASRIRVLIISHMFPNPEQLGSGSFVLDQAKALQNIGVDVRVISGRPYQLVSKKFILSFSTKLVDFFQLHTSAKSQWWTLDGIPVLYLPYSIFGTHFTHGWSYRAAVSPTAIGFAKIFKPHIIHAHTGYLDGMVADAISKKLNIPYIVTEHTGPFSVLMTNPVTRHNTLKSLTRANNILAVSSALKMEMLKYLPIKGYLVEVVPNVIDVNLFRPSRVKTRPISRLRLLFVGYFVPVKNIPLLLDAFSIVLKTWPDAALRLVGGAANKTDECELQRKVSQLGLSSSVVIEGYKDRTEVARIMRHECDLLVLSSRSETFGCVVAEAIACGKPAVVTPCGGPQDIITSNEFGEVCGVNLNPVALADSILSVMARLDTINPIKLHASAVDRFSGDVVANQLLSIYMRYI